MNYREISKNYTKNIYKNYLFVLKLVGKVSIKGDEKMVNLTEIIQTADWKKEKHVPAIDLEKEEKAVKIKIMVGKEIAHPNTTAHHINWIECYFKPEGEKFAVQVGRSEFTAHGASAQGADTSTLFTKPAVSFVLNTGKSGTIIAISYCNIHGLWQNSVEFKV